MRLVDDLPVVEVLLLTASLELRGGLAQRANSIRSSTNTDGSEEALTRTNMNSDVLALLSDFPVVVSGCGIVSSCASGCSIIDS